MPKGPAGSHGMFEMDANVIFASSKAGAAAWEFLKDFQAKRQASRLPSPVRCRVGGPMFGKTRS